MEKHIIETIGHVEKKETLKRLALTISGRIALFHMKNQIIYASDTIRLRSRAAFSERRITDG